MIDYTIPPVTNENALELAKSINDFTDRTVADIQSLTEIVQTELNKRYYVNHEPHVELPLGREYDYTCEVINDSLSDETITEYPHLFISGYLRSGDKLQFKPYSIDPNTLDNYSAVYINGQKVDFDVQTEYTCQAEPNSLEKLNLMFISTKENSPKLAIDYADIPLLNFDIIVYDDAGKSANVDVSSFIGSMEIGSLKYIGDMTWSYYGVSTLRSLEITGDINVTGEMMCPSLSTLIIPNVTNVPNTNTLVDSKNNLWDIDISNVQNTVENLQYANFGALALNCSQIGDFGLDRAYIDTLDTGDKCTRVGQNALTYSPVRKVRMGKSTATVGNFALYNNTQLQSVVINSEKSLTLEGSAIRRNTQLQKIFINGGNKITLGERAIGENNRLETIKFSESSHGVFNNFSLANNDNLQAISFGYIAQGTANMCDVCPLLSDISIVPNGIAPISALTTSISIGFRNSADLTEQSCLNIINGVSQSDSCAITISLASNTKTKMRSVWYCKLVDNIYISCEAEDEEAITQAEALIAKGGSLA